MEFLEINLIILSIIASANVFIAFLLKEHGKERSSIFLFSLVALSSGLWVGIGVLRYFVYLILGGAISPYLFTKLSVFFAVSIFFFFSLFCYSFPQDRLKLKKRTLFFFFLVYVVTIIFTFIPGVFVISEEFLIGNIQPKYYWGTLYLFIYVPVLIVFFLVGVFKLIKTYKTLGLETIEKKQILFILLGCILAGSSGLFFGLLVAYFPNLVQFFWIGRLSTIIFVSFVAYAIFRHRWLNLKILSTEVLVFVLWMVVLVRLMLAQNIKDFLISGFLLFSTVFIGFFLIRSVIKEVKQKEEIEKLAKKLEKTNNKLRELDKLKTEFLSLATHQIRSPLTSMRGYISMIFEGDYGEVNENLKEPLRVVEKSSEGLVKVVNDFLDVSRIEQGRMKYNLEIYDFHQIVKNIIEEYRPAIEEKGLKIEFEAKEDDYSVKVDENKMEQVIGNLIDNAIKYTIEGEIKVRLFKNDSKTLQLEVSDSGVGIPSEEIKKLFTKFQRAKGAEKTNVTGTGLGIYLAKRITEDHGGTIKVSSEGEGKGSVFTVILPSV